MLFPAALWPRIGAGEVTVAFRNWKQPTVRAGGTLQSPAGLLGIDAVDVIERDEITEPDAHAAGFASVDEVVADLRPGDDRRVHRIRFHRIGDDPRLELRAADRLSTTDRSAIDQQLARWDRASRSGRWTRSVLEAIRDHPGESSVVLAGLLGQERMQLKGRIRQLKKLGLTVSLRVGYRLSPRGISYVDRSDPDDG